MKRLFSLLFVFAFTVSTSAHWATPQGQGHSHDGHNHAHPHPTDVPAYNAAPPPKGAKLKPILSGDQLKTPTFRFPFQAKSYEVAAEVHHILYQLPCYCYCDRSPAQHNSLRSCFEDEHGANCAACMQEAFYAFQMHRQGKTVKQIRDGVIRGEHRLIDLRVAGATF